MVITCPGGELSLDAGGDVAAGHGVECCRKVRDSCGTRDGDGALAAPDGNGYYFQIPVSFPVTA